jgi:putative redox protein
MAVQITGTYTGKLKMELTHTPSGTSLSTAAPKDNQGDGSSFSPTDLLAAAFGSCVVTTMAIVAEREGIPFHDASFVIEKHMRSDPRRVDRLPITVRMPRGLTPPQRSRLEHIARNCPVEKSILPDIGVDFTFEYGDAGGTGEGGTADQSGS